MLLIAMFMLILVSASVILSRTSISLEDEPIEGAKLIILHYQDGGNITVLPSTPDGRKLLSACRNVLLHLSAFLICVGEDRYINFIKNKSDYIEIIFEEDRNFTLRADNKYIWPRPINVTARRVLLILSGERMDRVYFGGRWPPELREIMWSCEKANVDSKYFQELVIIANKLKPG
ncbi:MAG: hypothetical protein ACP5KE_04085 [Candidatus Methanodesulfokora sp.]